MATVKTSSITVGGKKVDPYYISIRQKCDWHHYFEVAVSAEKVEDTAESVNIDNSVAHVGKTVEVAIKCTSKELKFKGVITAVRIDRTYTGDNHVVFEGYSPTYLLEDGEGTKSYEKKDIGAIVNEILGTYPGNLVNPKVKAQYTTPIPYITRYKETNYHFLSRIAATYGEWFFYDGEGVNFGKLPNSGQVTVTLGKDLESFSYGTRARPSKFKYQFYNYKENRMLEEPSSSFKPGWLDTYGKKALDAADSIFPNEPTNPTWQDTSKDALIKHLTEVRKSAIVSDSTFLKGSSTNTGIAVGAKIQVKSRDGVIGNFRVTAATHRLDANKDYRNHFEAIPITVTAPPVDKSVFKPEAESQVAVVKENNDPDGLGRIRVQFKWQTGEEMTPWIRQMTNHASKDRGVYFVPELEDEVYIDFEQGNPDRPFMTGAKYHSNTPPEYFDPDNNFKSIKTRTGHTVLFNDTEGEESITIKDKNENIIFLNTAEESILISAPEDMVLKCKNMTIEVEENMQTKVGADKTTQVGGDMDSKIKGDTSFTTTKTTTIKSTKDIKIKSTQKVDMSGTSGVKVSSPATTEVKGTTKVKVNGTLAEVKASTKLDLKGGALANLKAGIVKIN